MKLKSNLFFLLIFLLLNVSFSSATKFIPQNSTKNLSQKLQRFAVIQKDSKETQISLFSRAFLNFLFIKKAGSTPFLRIRNFDESCLDSSEMEKRNILIEVLFISGSKIVIKNEYGNFKKFYATTNCGEYGPMNVFQRIENEIKLNRWFSLMNFCSKQYKKFDEIYESVEVKIQSNIKCGFFMNLGEDSYISEIPASNVFHPSKSIIFNSNSKVPDAFKDFIKFNEKENEVEMDLKKVLPEKLGFIEEKFFEIPSFRFDFHKDCSNILVFLQFYDNQKCMVTVSLDSENNLILETSFGTISISKNDLLKTKFFADSSMIYSITEFDSYLMPEFKNIILCEIYSTEILPYFKITNTKSNSKCSKSNIIFSGSLTIEKNRMSLFVSEKEEASPWLEALPYIGVLCALLFIGILSFFVYFCIQNHRKKKNKSLKEKQKLLAKLPTAKDEKDLEPNTLSEIIEKEIEGKEIQQKPKTFKVIVPAIEKNISNNKSCLGERE